MAPEPLNFEDRTHSDFGALQQRVAGTETRLNEIATSVGQLRSETRAQISELSSTLGAQIGEIGRSFNNSRSTNWNSFFSTGAAVLTVVMSIGASVLIPMSSNISRNYVSIESLKATHFSHDDAGAMRDQLSKYIETVSNRSVTHAENDIEMKRIDDLRNSEIKRLEDLSRQRTEYVTANLARLDQQIKSLVDNSERQVDADNGQRRNDERINTIVSSMNELRHETGSSFTIGDRVKGLEAEISDLRRALTVNPGSSAAHPAD